MTDHFPAKIGLSQQFPCSYLDNKQEQLLVILDHNYFTAKRFEYLLELGFRRSGDQIYRPHCPACSACQSVRVKALEFSPSTSQRRKLKKAKSLFHYKVTDQERPEYYDLYARYINLRHRDGSMFPPNHVQYESFLFCRWLPISFIELWYDDKLIAVAVTDTMPTALSAIYTFYDPDFEQYSLGTVMILLQLEVAKRLEKSFLYLGYQIDACKKMRYKIQFEPSQRLVNDQWLNI
ncbi:Leucyl/phenylalanyl-tRNA--protein transferase [Pseudoalteromonas luteoviolacea B = ATCC 29581]|nr:Leucyl/phenylalanyl-tRNA--protein transferase [Pseudoalteromonas luteoviolacea B = ATCC 29581]